MKIETNELIATVLIANYNNSQFIDQCLTSVINQNYKKIEINEKKNNYHRKK